jgi:hypothetical protein
VARSVPQKPRLRGEGVGQAGLHQAGHHETREARRRSGPAVRIEPQAGAANGGRGGLGAGRGVFLRAPFALGRSWWIVADGARRP